MGKLTEKGKGLMNDFKVFITRGNVIDMAVGVVMGTAFGKIVSSLVADIIMPFVGVILGGTDFSSLKLTVGAEAITYGVFIQAIIDFLIIALCMFVVIKVVAALSRKKKEEPKEEEPPAKAEDIVLLEEIRDLLKEKNN